MIGKKKKLSDDQIHELLETTLYDAQNAIMADCSSELFVEQEGDQYREFNAKFREYASAVKIEWGKAKFEGTLKEAIKLAQKS